MRRASAKAADPFLETKRALRLVARASLAASRLEGPVDWPFWKHVLQCTSVVQDRALRQLRRSLSEAQQSKLEEQPRGAAGGEHAARAAPSSSAEVACGSP